MNINQSLLAQAGEKGAQNATKALSVLIGKEVKVEIINMKMSLLDDLIKEMQSQEAYRIIAYSQLITGVSGAVFMIMNRKDALLLVDSLTNKKSGETKILQAFDQDAIKETLNIVSNSYITALVEDLGITTIVEPPTLITSQRITETVKKIVQGNEEIVDFETKLTITDIQSDINLFILFDPKFVNLEKGGEA
jgi:chemotaxis protein CheY-P-specific phosphatase CheC